MREKSFSNNSNIEEPSTTSILTVLYPYIPILLVILIFSRREGLSGYGGATGTQSKGITIDIGKAIKNPDIKRALQSVCAYLDEKEQVPIHTLAGALEIINTMQQLLDSSYKIQGLPYATVSNKIEKQLGVINILKDYAHEEDKNLLEAVESAITTAKRIQRVIQAMKVSEGINKDKIDLDKGTEDIDVLEPLPKDKNYDSDKIKEIIELVEMTDLSNNQGEDLLQVDDDNL
ncbi:hypothetical protein SAMN05446037_103536 [Anaerovirgula multivorans]|uniref:Uncharacterized protein n=1 Tax=Anaerovirgula multivorans TaxID=312168 RepID=A0A239JG29_9FIRM|nr:hypothetical protein [Anaerovirgula multivorans]SNT04785.1 hypothetical protein SAMN05446037_103536 [Anaerovirgula multivorans]